MELRGHGTANREPEPPLGNGLCDPGDKIGAGKLIVLVRYDHLITGPQGCSGSARAVVASAAGGFAPTWASHVSVKGHLLVRRGCGGEGGWAAGSASDTCELRGEKCVLGTVPAPCSHLRADGGTASCPTCSISTTYGSACRLQRQTRLAQTLTLNPGALRP